MMNSIDVSSKSSEKKDFKDERRFVQIPPETVQLIAETVGISQVQPNIARALSEDASYRCREIVHFCAQLLRHGKRRKLTTYDFDRALRWYDADPIHGQGSKTRPNFIRIPETDIYVPDDEKIINLTNYSLSNTSHPISNIQPLVKASWLSLEGTYLSQEDAKPIEHPQPSQLTRALSQYYTATANVILGNSTEMLNIILNDLKTNSKIGVLLPYFVTFIRNALQKHCDNRVVTKRLLYFLEALFSNKFLNLSPKPYLSHLVTGLLSSLIVERRGKELSEADKLSLKVDHVPLASRILRQVLDRWATPVNMLRTQTLRALREYLKDPNISYSSQYGALSAMIALGPKVLEDCLIPQMDTYFTGLFHKFESDPKNAKVVVQMIGMILMASRAVLTYRAQNVDLDSIMETKKDSDRKVKFFADVYYAMYEFFGDDLSVVPLPPIYFPLISTPVSTSIKDQRVKFRIRKCGNYISRAGESMEVNSSTSTSALPSSTISRDIIDESPSENIFSQNFDHLADMGVPSDIFDEASSDGFMETTTTANPVSINEPMISNTVQSEFELSSNVCVTRYPMITFKLNGVINAEVSKLRRKTFEDRAKYDDQKIRRNCFMGKRYGTHYSERPKLVRLCSGSLYTKI